MLLFLVACFLPGPASRVQAATRVYTDVTLGYFAHFRTFKIFPVARNEISSLTNRKSLGISILNDIDIH